MYRSSVLLLFSFLVGLLIYQLATSFISDLTMTNEMKILLNRSFLSIILIAIVLSQLLVKHKINFFTVLPDWKSHIQMPFHKITVWGFLLIGLVGSSTILLPLLRFTDSNHLKSLFLFALLFAILNGVLEEFIWRGVLLSSLNRDISTIYAVVITSVGFGLLHISIGIPMIVSILFSFGGLFYAIVVLKTKSIYPAIVFHIIINLGMVLNGWII